MKALAALTKLIASISFFLAIAALTARADFTPEEWKKLRNGEVTFSGVPAENPDGSHRIDFVTKIYVKAPMQEVWKTVRDYEHFHEFMPKVTKVTVLKREGNLTWVRYDLKVLWLKVTYHLSLVDDDSRYRVDWTLDRSKENTVRDIVGYWDVDDAPGGSGVVLSYASFVDTGIPAPMKIVQKLASMALPQVVKNVRMRAESGGKWKKPEGS